MIGKAKMLIAVRFMHVRQHDKPFEDF